VGRQAGSGAASRQCIRPNSLLTKASPHLLASALVVVQNSDEGKAYMDLAKRVDEAISFMSACGLDMNSSVMKETEFYVSHECLLMDYEEALTREDSTTGLWYGCSGHFLWCGERTRQLDNAHVEYLRGIANPIGVKVGQGVGARRQCWLRKKAGVRTKTAVARDRYNAAVAGLAGVASLAAKPALPRIPSCQLDRPPPSFCLTLIVRH
jgi:hypothetical protein